jgi:hypothetical protein
MGDLKEEKDDDEKTFTLSLGVEETLASPPRRGMGLDLTKAAAASKSEADDEAQPQEQEVLVIFELPDGSQAEYPFKMGHTVELLKSHVESEYGIPMSEQTLFLDDVLLMDPLSLMDYPTARNENELFVRVEGPLPAGSHK